MHRRAYRWVRAVVPALSAAFLLSGCATMSGPQTPAALGAGKHRSIKDDPEPAYQAAAPKQAQPKSPKTAMVAPYRPAAANRPPHPGMPTCAAGSDCTVRLKAMIDDPSHGWIGQPQSPAEYANGTRLFAYRVLRDKLTCNEIGVALTEIDAAAKTFRLPVAGVSAEQASRLLALNSDVRQELGAELRSRCKG